MCFFGGVGSRERDLSVSDVVEISLSLACGLKGVASSGCLQVDFAGLRFFRADGYVFSVRMGLRYRLGLLCLHLRSWMQNGSLYLHLIRCWCLWWMTENMGVVNSFEEGLWEQWR